MVRYAERTIRSSPGSPPVHPDWRDSFMSKVEEEISSQPGLWRMVKERAAEWQQALPASGCRLAVVGCGTSYYVGRAFAAIREARQHGETDAFAASEFLFNRKYDTVLVISRSGTTAEVLRVLEQVP